MQVMAVFGVSVWARNMNGATLVDPKLSWAAVEQEARTRSGARGEKSGLTSAPDSATDST
jgi:hypothetical protein